MKRIGFVCIALGVVSCGPPSQIDAVNQASNHGCDYYQRCGLIGSASNAAYPDRAHCIVSLQGQFNGYWPVNACDKHISSSGLSSCLSAEDNTACGNVADFLNTVFNKCSEPTVCSGATPTDGG